MHILGIGLCMIAGFMVPPKDNYRGILAVIIGQVGMVLMILGFLK